MEIYSEILFSNGYTISRACDSSELRDIVGDVIATRLLWPENIISPPIEEPWVWAAISFVGTRSAPPSEMERESE